MPNQEVLSDNLETQEDILAPQPIKLNEEQTSRLVNTVTKNYVNTRTSTYYQKLIKELSEFHSIYLGQMEETSYPWTNASNVDLGIVEMCVDNIKSRYKLSTIGSTPMFNTIPVTPAGETKKQAVTDSMTYILDEDLDIDPVLDTIAQNTVEYGTQVSKLFWKRDLQETREYTQIAGVVIPQDVTRTTEKGCVENIELQDLIIPEGSGEDIQKLPWVYHRLWYSVYDLEKKVRLNFFSEAKVEEIKAGLVSQKTNDQMSAEEKIKVYKQLPEEKVEILECYMRFDADDDGVEEECVFWVCPSTNTYMKGFYLKDLYHNGLRPFYVFRYKSTGSFYGRGVCEILRPYRKLMNDIFNFAVNCQMLQVLPWGFYRIGSSFKPEEVRLAPGMMVPVDDVNDVKMAQFPGAGNMLDNVVMLIMSFVERQTGISSPHMGKEFPTRKTATEVRTIISEGNVKHEDRIATFQDNFSKMLKGVYHLYRQNQPKDRTGRIGSSDSYRFVELFSAFDGLGDYDFMVLGTLTTGNKTVEREDAMALYAITAQDPIFQQWPIGRLEMLKEVFSTYGKRNIQRFLPPDELVKAFTQMSLGQLFAQMQQPPEAQEPGPAQGGENAE